VKYSVSLLHSLLLVMVDVAPEALELEGGIFAVQLIILKSAAKPLNRDARPLELDIVVVLLHCLGCRSVLSLETLKLLEWADFQKKMRNRKTCKSFRQGIRFQS
jgi:hypothetical protein